MTPTFDASKRLTEQQLNTLRTLDRCLGVRLSWLSALRLGIWIWKLQPCEQHAILMSCCLRLTLMIIALSHQDCRIKEATRCIGFGLMGSKLT